ncbi:hypothetical protein [uncultured Sphingomonas sp.]|uniref:hypothetical protein n=1 Tax=uncultured Sphingomonas sp. TaxID=158754 RepID=UPI0025E44D48|nr:hypothetical protein [uncultured Sphingomonas sp.]
MRQIVRDGRHPPLLPPPERPMIGLSVAVGRFVEALFWAILRVAGVVTVVVVAIAVGALLVAIVARKIWARQKRLKAQSEHRP